MNKNNRKVRKMLLNQYMYVKNMATDV